MEFIIDVVLEAGLDCLKMLPFLFAAFLLIEALEHYSENLAENMLARVKHIGPVAGALTGCIPQCGFSVMASNLYAGGLISVGTLLSVFIATSDEAILIILGNPGRGREVAGLLCMKIIIAVMAGYFVDIFLGKRISTMKVSGNLCGNCGCHDEKGIVKPALHHTIKIFFYLLIFTVILNLIMEIFGIENISRFLLGNTIWQPVAATIIGLIPNCASSVMLTQLYLSGAISFASVISGLCAGAGIGLAVLFKMNHNKKENIKILLLLFFISAFSGIVLETIGL